MQIGVVGVGRMGRFHARFLSGRSDIDRFVLAYANDQRAVKLAGDLGADSASFPEMVEDVDGVVITASTSAHPELIMHCVDAGKPSFCQKPISLDLASSERVVDYVREANGQLQMGFQRGFDPGHRAAHGLVESDGLGDEPGVLSAFLEFAKGERENPCTVENARDALRVAVACNLSRARDNPVALEVT